MTLYSSVALVRHVARFVVGLVLSPFGYAKELVLSAALIAVVLGTISGLQAWWMTESPSAASSSEALKRPSISRLMVLPSGDIILSRDFTEIVVVDAEGEERHQRPIASPEYFHFGQNETGWSCVSVDPKRNVQWMHSALGDITCESEATSAASTPHESMHDLSHSADGLTAAVLHQRIEVLLWKRADDGSATFQRWPLAKSADKIFVSPQGRRIAVKACDNTLKWMDPQTGEVNHETPTQVMLPLCHAWSHDEQWFAIGTDDRDIHVWRTDSDSGPAYTLADVGNLFSLTMSDDGRWIVAGMATGELSAWRDGRLVWTKPAHPAGIRGLDLADNEQTIVTGCMHGRLMVHDLKTGKLLREIRNERSEPAI